VSETGTKAAELLIPFVECEQDLEAEIGARYGSPDVHPAMQRRYERDMETIERSRAARTRLLAYISELEADRERMSRLEGRLRAEAAVILLEESSRNPRSKAAFKDGVVEMLWRTGRILDGTADLVEAPTNTTANTNAE
jgi:hypothetical protein